MKLIATVVLLCCTAAFAADPPTKPADAPLADLDAPGRSAVLEAGEIAPFKGELSDEQETRRRSRRDGRWLGELDDAHKSFLIPKPVFVTIIVGVVIVVAGVSAGVTKYVDDHKR
jgi:hypothetical protein